VRLKTTTKFLVSLQLQCNFFFFVGNKLILIYLFEFLVHCQDHGLPTPMTSWTTLKVHIKDVNDNEPKFTKTKINLKIPEDSNIGDEVYRFEATDEDLGLNGKVNYLLLGNNLNGFILNSLTGIMTIGK